MLISNIINDSFGILSRQLKFYCWHFRRHLDHRQREELIDLLNEQHFDRLAIKIKSLDQIVQAECRSQVGKLLIDHCFARNKTQKLEQLIESKLIDIDVRLDNYGRTLLHRSAYNLDVSLVRILIKNGVNLKLRDYAGNTALHIAIQSYRNGSVLYGNSGDIAKNLTSIIKLILNADRDQQRQRFKMKRIKLSSRNELAQDTQQAIAHRDSVQKQIFDNSLPSADLSPMIFNANKKFCNSVRNHSCRNGVVPDNSKMNSVNGSHTTKDSNYLDPPNSCTAPNPFLLEDLTSPLINTKNAFGRTVLHYCVLVVGEQHLEHFVKILLSYGADVDAIDSKLRTPLYCLVKRPGVVAIKQKFYAMDQLLSGGCDDLGLSIKPNQYFTDELIQKLESNQQNIMQSSEEAYEPIFVKSTFKRVPSLKHLCRLYFIKSQPEAVKLKRQTSFKLPPGPPSSLNYFMNRKILDQSEFF